MATNQLPKLPNLPKIKKYARCTCGCNGLTQSRFVPGHDSIHYGMIKRVQKGYWDPEQPNDAIAQLDAAAEAMSVEQAKATAEAMGIDWTPVSERKAGKTA